MSRRYVLLAVVGLIAAAAWWWWPPDHASREPSSLATRSMDADATPGPKAMASSGSDGAVPSGLMLRPMGRRGDAGPTKPAAFRIGSIEKRYGHENPVYVKGRAMARSAWLEFVEKANPTEEQQQAILSAFYDAQLYREDVEQVEREWSTDWAYKGGDKAAGPRPEIDVMQDVLDAIYARATEVLEPRQLEIFKTHFVTAVWLAVVGDLVEPESMPPPSAPNFVAPK